MSLSQKGLYGENRAAFFLEKNGYKIIGRNFRSLFGEIDLITKKDGVYYFCEVKTRWNVRHGYPEEAVSKFKLDKIVKTINYYKLVSHLPDIKTKIVVVAQLFDGKEMHYQKLIDVD